MSGRSVGANHQETGGFCGCCGNETAQPDDLWCMRCRGHVGAYGPIWERTWFALTGEDCPHQTGVS